MLTGDLLLGRLTLIEFLELYVIDLVLFAVAGYGVYRLTLWTVENRLPDSLDTLDSREAEGGSNDDSGDDATRGNDRW